MEAHDGAKAFVVLYTLRGANRDDLALAGAIKGGLRAPLTVTGEE